MNVDVEKVQPISPQRHWLKMFLLVLPMMLLTFVMLGHGTISSDPKSILAFSLTFLFFNALFFLMFSTGKTDRYRSILFITFAICFIISFISHLFEIRGTMVLKAQNFLEGETPFCHLVIPMTLIPLAFTRTIIFPGTILGGFASVASMFALWIGATLALGRGFCGWACFFGGLDDGFSRLMKKPLIKKIDAKWTYLPFAVLLVIALISAVTLSPTYCAWLCPFKSVTEFVEVTSVKILIQTVLFISLFIGLVIVLPILTKRRIQCGLFCPFGAFQSFTNKINPFEIRMNQERCVKCKRCIQVCPTFSINEESMAQGKARFTCMKCGKCIDSCPKEAIYYHVKGTPLNLNLSTYRLLFLYPAFLFLATMAGGDVQHAIVRVIRLMTTGSMMS